MEILGNKKSTQTHVAAAIQVCAPLSTLSLNKKIKTIMDRRSRQKAFNAIGLIVGLIYLSTNSKQTYINAVRIGGVIAT